MSDYRVRPATSDDAPRAVAAIRDSITKLCALDHRDDTPTLEAWLRNKTAEHFLSWLADPQNVVVVVEAESMVRGVGLLHVSGEVRLCYVAAGYERRGLGQALLEALEAQAQSFGLSEIRLSSTATARPFYERAGYRFFGEPIPRSGIVLGYPCSKTLSEETVDSVPRGARDPAFSIEMADSHALSPQVLKQVKDLCSEAYREDFTLYLRLIGPGVHLLGRYDGALVSHVMWVTRWLQPAGQKPLCTAYVEAVATLPAFQRRGFGTWLMARLGHAIRGYELGALSPNDDRFYDRLGWQLWKGPLFIRKGSVLEATPDERILFKRLPRTPEHLDGTELVSIEWREGEVW